MTSRLAGVGIETAKHTKAMDSKGAIILARRLAARHGAGPAPLTPDPAADPSAAPIYRWLGIAPPAAGAQPPVLRPETAAE